MDLTGRTTGATLFCMPTTEQLALTTIASIGDTLTTAEAAAILGCNEDDVRSLILTAVTAHGEREGAADYQGRAADVARGAEAENWASPLNGADDAYVSAVGTDRICREIGVDASQWDAISSDWLAAFCRGYSAAAK